MVFIVHSNVQDCKWAFQHSALMTNSWYLWFCQRLSLCLHLRHLPSLLVMKTQPLVEISCVGPDPCWKIGAFKRGVLQERGSYYLKIGTYNARDKQLPEAASLSLQNVKRSCIWGRYPILIYVYVTKEDLRRYTDPKRCKHQIPLV